MLNNRPTYLDSSGIWVLIKHSIMDNMHYTPFDGLVLAHLGVLKRSPINERTTNLPNINTKNKRTTNISARKTNTGAHTTTFVVRTWYRVGNFRTSQTPKKWRNQLTYFGIVFQYKKQWLYHQWKYPFNRDFLRLQVLNKDSLLYSLIISPIL